MNEGIKRADLFLLKNALLAAAAASLAFASSFSGSYTIESVQKALALGCLTFSAYQLASWHPVITNSWFILSRKPGLFNGVVTLVLGLSGIFLLRERLFLLLIPGALTLLYYLRWSSGWLRGGIRSFFLVKNILVGLIWTFLTYNLAITDQQVNGISWAGRFIFIVILTLALDLRDIESDLQKNVRTIPAILGFRRARTLIFVFTVLSLAVLYFFHFPFRNATLLALTITALVILVLKPQTGYWTYFFLLDGIMPLHALFILLLR